MEEETTRASAPSALEENLYGNSGYASLNGIAPKGCGLESESFRAPADQAQAETRVLAR